MPSIIVTSAPKNKFKVLVNYIQRGIDYATKEQAEREANKIREQYGHTGADRNSKISC